MRAVYEIGKESRSVSKKAVVFVCRAREYKKDKFITGGLLEDFDKDDPTYEHNLFFEICL
jgi:hypothetical protein